MYRLETCTSSLQYRVLKCKCGSAGTVQSCWLCSKHFHDQYAQYPLLGYAVQMAREVTQLRGQQMKLRAVCESEMQRAATDAASGIEGLQLRWRQVPALRLHMPVLLATLTRSVCSHGCLDCHKTQKDMPSTSEESTGSLPYPRVMGPLPYTPLTHLSGQAHTQHALPVETMCACAQVLEGLRAEASAADQAHTQAVAAARQGESQLWQERLQQAEAAAHQQVCGCLLQSLHIQPHTSGLRAKLISDAAIFWPQLPLV